MGDLFHARWMGMAKKPFDDVRDGVAQVFNSDPAAQIVNAVGKIGEAANTAVEKVRSAFTPMLPGQTPPKRQRGDINLPKDKK